MEVRASIARVRVSARKARLVADAVRGKPVLEAQQILRFIPNKTAVDLEKLMKDALDRKTNAPDSFLFATNSLAVKGLKEISKRNIRIPDDLGVVSFDESEALDFFYSPVTYINQTTDLIAKEAVNMLVRQMKAVKEDKLKIKPEQTVINATLVVRKSSRKKK